MKCTKDSYKNVENAPKISRAKTPTGSDTAAEFLITLEKSL